MVNSGKYGFSHRWQFGPVIKGAYKKHVSMSLKQE